MKTQECELCHEKEAEFECEHCGKLICGDCWNSNGLCDDCNDELNANWDKYHGPFA